MIFHLPDTKGRGPNWPRNTHRLIREDLGAGRASERRQTSAASTGGRCGRDWGSELDAERRTGGGQGHGSAENRGFLPMLGAVCPARASCPYSRRAGAATAKESAAPLCRRRWRPSRTLGLRGLGEPGLRLLHNLGQDLRVTQNLPASAWGELLEQSGHVRHPNFSIHQFRGLQLLGLLLR